jgi:hypothetical protein
MAYRHWMCHGQLAEASVTLRAPDRIESSLNEAKPETMRVAVRSIRGQDPVARHMSCDGAVRLERD